MRDGNQTQSAGKPPCEVFRQPGGQPASQVSDPPQAPPLSIALGVVLGTARVLDLHPSEAPRNRADWETVSFVCMIS